MNEYATPQIKNLINNLGFDDDPFAKTNADEEDRLPEYFIGPPFFNSVTGIIDSPKSNVVFAPRGGGKTSLKCMIEKLSRNEPFLCITYNTFDVSKYSISQIGLDYHLKNITKLGTVAIVTQAYKKGINRLSSEDRHILYLLIKTNISILTQSELREAIESIKNTEDKIIEFWNKFSGPIGLVLNNLLSQIGFDKVEISKFENEAGDLGEYFDQLKFIAEIGQKLGFKSIYILIDKIDETAITGTASDSFNFIKSLLSDLQILELSHYGFKFFLWDKLLDEYRTIARPDRIKYYNLNWNPDQLEEMLNKRLRSYSQNKVLNFKDIVDFETKIDINKIIVSFGEGSPRNIIRICKEILDQQAEINSGYSKISERAFIKGFETFSENYTLENFPDKMVKELKKNRLIDFTITHVYSDVFKFTQQAGISKVKTWVDNGLVEKIGTIKESKGSKPSHHYILSNIIVAKHILSDQNIFNFFENKVRWCPGCGKLLLRDWDIRQILPCDECQIDVNFE